MAEIELSVLSRQYLDRCIPCQTTLAPEVAGCRDGRNKAVATVDWCFPTDDAWIKLKKHYPSIHA